MCFKKTNLLLLVVELLPLCSEQLPNLTCKSCSSTYAYMSIAQKKKITKASIWVLGLDSLTPVLAKEHVGRQCTLWCLGVLLGLGTRSLLCLFRGLALGIGQHRAWERDDDDDNDSDDGKHARKSEEYYTEHIVQKVRIQNRHG